MPLAKDVATELRKLAYALDQTPDQSVPKPFILFSADDKDSFLRIARSIPRPFKKSIDGEDTRWPEITVTHETETAYIWAKVPQSLTCELVEPAKPAVYRCEPILSAEEDAELEVA